MSFFVADNPTGSANLGGLAGADQICQNAAQVLGGRDAARTWRAYLSQEQRGAMPRINARDRIGNGPWYNVRHQLIASSVADLHGDQQRDRNNVRRETALDLRAEQIPGNQHDILTGSDPDGRSFTDGYDRTCNNWTSEAMAYPQTNPNVPADGARAMIGHSDRSGQNTSWISSHLTQGCSKQALINIPGAQVIFTALPSTDTTLRKEIPAVIISCICRRDSIGITTGVSQIAAACRTSKAVKPADDSDGQFPDEPSVESIGDCVDSEKERLALSVGFMLTRGLPSSR